MENPHHLRELTSGHQAGSPPGFGGAGAPPSGGGAPNSGRRTPGLLLWVGLSACALLASAVLAAETNLSSLETPSSGSSQDLPKLRPPLPEIEASFWERHRFGITSAAGVLALAGALGIWYWLRPKPPVRVPPVVQAQEALEPLRHRPENGAVLSRVGQVTRRYFTAAFGLPPVELTTTEFCQTIVGTAEVGTELAEAVGDFLRQCDQRKFAPGPTSPPLEAVSRATRLIEQAEVRRAAVAREAADDREHPGAKSSVP